MKKYKLTQNFTVIEKQRVPENARGWAEQDGSDNYNGKGKRETQIKQSLSDEDKLMTFVHELAHHIWFIAEENKGNNELAEQIAEETELIIMQAILKYAPFSRGVIEVLQKRGANGKA